MCLGCVFFHSNKFLKVLHTMNIVCGMFVSLVQLMFVECTAVNGFEAFISIRMNSHSSLPPVYLQATC